MNGKVLHKTIAALFVVTMMLSSSVFNVFAAAPKTVTAALNGMKVIFNGEPFKIVQTYMIDNYNYVRVREVAAPLNYSIAPCGNGEVGVVIAPDYPYVDAGPMETLNVANPTVTLTTGTVYYNGSAFNAQCFLYADRYYFKLADLAAASDKALAATKDMVKSQADYAPNKAPTVKTYDGLAVSWDAATNIVHVDKVTTDLVKVFNDFRGGAVSTSTPTPTLTATPAPAAATQVPLTSAPAEGTVLAKILIDPSKGAYGADGKPIMSNFTTPYTYVSAGEIGQCSWYVVGRLLETTGVNINNPPNRIHGLGIPSWVSEAMSGKYPNLTGSTDPKAVAARSIAVWSGHVAFVEWVDKDSAGNPTIVYFSDGGHDGGVYKIDGMDGVIQKKTYADFLNYMGKDTPLLGYVTAK